MTFLIVDSSAAVRRTIKGALRRLGHVSVLEARDGCEALECFDRSIDLVIIDRDLACVSGLEFVRSIRTRLDGPKVSILMMAEHGSQDDIRTAVDTGVDYFLVKPFTARVLEEEVERALSSILTLAG